MYESTSILIERYNKWIKKLEQAEEREADDNYKKKNEIKI